MLGFAAGVFIQEYSILRIAKATVLQVKKIGNAIQILNMKNLAFVYLIIF